MTEVIRDCVIFLLWFIAFIGLISIVLMAMWVALLEAFGWFNERKNEEETGKYRAERGGRWYESSE